MLRICKYVVDNGPSWVTFFHVTAIPVSSALLNSLEFNQSIMSSTMVDCTSLRLHCLYVTTSPEIEKVSRTYK